MACNYSKIDDSGYCLNGKQYMFVPQFDEYSTTSNKLDLIQLQSYDIRDIVDIISAPLS